ncbi:MAG: hydroxypyruvate isomerase family protein [Phycisphaerales bacterium JB059]
MERRTFLAGMGAAGVAGLTAGVRAAPGGEEPLAPFSMAFAPHFGMFRHHAGEDPVAQLEFAAAQGFRAWEDNGMGGRAPEEQERIARAMERLGMRIGVFVLNPSTAWGPTFSRGDRENRQAFLDEARRAVDIAMRVNATWMTVVPGTRDPRLDLGYQTASAIDQLREAAEILEPHGLVMVLEPLNPQNHPNMLLAKMAHAYEICRGVNSSACKILCDLYHQQITEGNLIPNIDRCWEEIAYFQMGDTPGRSEPTTGEINFLNVFTHIKSKGFTGILGMEHGNSRPGEAGERAVIEAYRACDPV